MYCFSCRTGKGPGNLTSSGMACWFCLSDLVQRDLFTWILQSGEFRIYLRSDVNGTKSMGAHWNLCCLFLANKGRLLVTAAWDWEVTLLFAVQRWLHTAPSMIWGSSETWCFFLSITPLSLSGWIYWRCSCMMHSFCRLVHWNVADQWLNFYIGSAYWLCSSVISRAAARKTNHSYLWAKCHVEMLPDFHGFSSDRVTVKIYFSNCLRIIFIGPECLFLTAVRNKIMQSGYAVLVYNRTYLCNAQIILFPLTVGRAIFVSEY